MIFSAKRASGDSLRQYFQCISSSRKFYRSNAFVIVTEHCLTHDVLNIVNIANELTFQQDGTPSHYKFAVYFLGRWIGWKRWVECPTKSADLSPLDFPCGQLKEYRKIISERLYNILKTAFFKVKRWRVK